MSDTLHDEIVGLDVFDTHTHLRGGALPASDFWEIGEYFWLLRELRAAGYPPDAAELPAEQRAEEYARAFTATRNTAMNHAVRRALEDLYGLQITDAASVLAADEAVRETATRTGWAAEVLDRCGVRRVVVNVAEDADFGDLHDACVLLPRIEGRLSAWVGRIASAPCPAEGAAQAADEIERFTTQLARDAVPGLMTSLDRFHMPTHPGPPTLEPAPNLPRRAQAWVLHAICAAAHRHGLVVQLFLGMERGWSSQITAHGRSDRILALHGLLDRYDCRFDLVLATHLNNLDAVQAARMFPNVHVGGLWWFNFRPSTYRDAMQYRLEALPPRKSALVASDARCVEWCYAKVMLVKRLMAEVLSEEVRRGHLKRETAVWVAREWLHDAGAALYEGGV